MKARKNYSVFLLIVALAGWLVPGAGFYLLNEKKRAIIIFIAITLTFCTGLYVGSVGVVDPVGSWPWYIAQIMSSPFVALLGHISAGGGYAVYGRPNEIGQLYTSVAGLLNLLCVICAVYLAHLRTTEKVGG